MTELYNQDRLTEVLKATQAQLMASQQLGSEEAQQQARDRFQESWTVEYSIVIGLLRTEGGASMVIESPKSVIGCLNLLQSCGIDLNWPVAFIEFEGSDALVESLFASAAALSQAVGEHLTLLQECQEFADFKSEGLPGVELQAAD